MPELIYPVVLHAEPGVGFGVTVPDLPGCFSAGDTSDEAVCAAREAIECHLEGLLMSGDDLPLPSPIASHVGSAQSEGGVWSLVPVDLGAIGGEVKRVNVTLKAGDLANIDAYVKHAGLDRSDFFVSSALLAMAARAKP